MKPVTLLRHAAEAQPTSASRNRSAPARWFVVVLLAVLCVHAALGWLFIQRLLDIKYIVEPDFADLAEIVGIAFAVAAALLWRFPERTTTIAATSIVTVAIALASPGAVATVALMMLSAYVVGERAMAWLRRGSASDADPPDAPVLMLIGACLWMTLIGATLPLRIHTQPVYAAMLILSLIVFPRSTASAIRNAGQWIAQARPTPPWSERGWVAVLIAITVVHLVLVARPEVGYDAGTMHLQFAELLQAHRKWTFDVTRYAWAVMPLGADLGYAAAFVLDGETAARLLNFTYGALLLAITYRLITLYARREIALAGITLLASMPLAFTETASLYVENLWIAFLMAALLVALRFERERSPGAVGAFALLAAGAMQCKVIGVFWLAPLACSVGYLAWRAPATLKDRRVRIVLVVALAIAAFPYLNAWARTGNPVFPFMNALFRSPYIDTTTSFNNALYNTPLSVWTPYQVVLSSGKFIEGTDGALGAHWLLAIPLVILAVLTRRPRTQWFVLALAAFFFVAVFVQQSYLRYLLPAIVLSLVFAMWVLDDVAQRRIARAAIVIVGAALCFANLRFIASAGWPNAKLCLKCSYDVESRRNFVAELAPHRVISDYLNRALPNARVGLFLLNWPSPSGYTGYSRAANWHDWSTYRALVTAEADAAIGDIVKKNGLTHIVYSSNDATVSTDAVRSYASHHAMPVWRFRDYIVAEIKPE